MAVNDNDLLRLLLDDTLVSGQQPFFDEEVITDLLARAGGSVYAAAATGWLIRAAEYHVLIPIDESGSKRDLSQKYKNAIKQADAFAKLSGGVIDGTSNPPRVVAKVATLRESEPIPVTHYRTPRA